MTKRRTLLAVALLWGAVMLYPAVTEWAAPTATITGRVVDDQTGEGIADAEVRLQASLTDATRTAADGSFTLRTSRGENTSAAWGVANFLLRLEEKYRPDYIAWVHDAGSSFRERRYTEYKSTREKLDAELQADFDRAVERTCQLLEAFRVPVITVPGYEADDVIGTLATQAADAGLQTVIVSGD